jgi:Ca2+-binding RTX toxin-like protein
VKIQGTENPDIIQGTSQDDEILSLGGNDTIFGSAGQDTINGGEGIDTLDLKNLGVPVTVTLATSVTFRNPTSTPPSGEIVTTQSRVKSSLGQVDSVDVETIIAPANQINTIDESVPRTEFNTGVQLDRVDINLEKETFIDGSSRNPFFVTRTNIKNFTNAIGSPGTDNIVGNSANNSLTGNTGNDTLDGRDGNDTLLGTSATARGVGELDSLTGGAGSDRFILGDSSGAYYKTQGQADLAKITDFGSGDVIQLGAKDTYSVSVNGNGLDLFVTTGGTHDLIANVQIPNPGSIVNGIDIPGVDNILPGGTEVGFHIDSGQTLGIFVGA